MPISKQAKKRMRSDNRKRLSNQTIESKIKTLNKKNKTLKKKDDAEKHARILYKEIDKAASKGVIPKKRADRIKSRTAKRLATL